MPEIKHHPVISSNIESIGFDDDTKTLEIKFKSGKTYSYLGVSKKMYEGIFKADSIGKFVHRFIINGKYKAVKK